MNLFNKIEDIKLNSIKISFDLDCTTPLPLGASKFGGCPDLPKEFRWYYFSGESPFTKKIKERPLSFLAQINCKEVKKYDTDNRLPSTGILYFFYELETMEWGFSHQDKGCSRVYYYDGDISSLEKTNFPDDMNQDYKLPELKLIFNSIYNAPSFEELYDDYRLYSWDDYDDFLKQHGYKIEDNNYAKLLGYSDNIQGDMLLECELVTNGLNCGDGTGYKSPKRKELEKNKNQWKLLFQLDTVTTHDFELMFGDCGRIYYFIKDEDLKNKNFDNTWLILQCY